MTESNHFIGSHSQEILARLGVCSWSLQPSSSGELVEKLEKIGLKRIQLDLDPLREHPEPWADLAERLSAAGISLVSGMFRTVGEDYSSLESIRETGGLVPDSTWAENWQNLQQTVTQAKQLGLTTVMTHAGFLPHEPSDPNFEKMVQRMRDIASLFADHGLTLCCETGQESAEGLVTFLEHLPENVAVNFDPANMLLYGNGDPIEALRTIGARVLTCHLKDAKLAQVPGTWGEEVAVGQGEVDWPLFFQTMKEIGYQGDFCIECEAGDQRLEDIIRGRDFVRKLVNS